MMMYIKTVNRALNRMKTWCRLTFSIHIKILLLALVVVSLSGCSLFSPYPITNNNDFSSSTLLSTKYYTAEQSCLSSYDKKDYYTFNIVDTGNYWDTGNYGILLYQEDSKQFAGFFTLYDSNRNPISDPVYLDSLNFNGEHTFTLTEGKYYIELERYKGYMYYTIAVYNTMHL